jgi:hypothetical protein
VTSLSVRTFATVQTAPATDVQPPHPVKVDIRSGAAVSAMVPLMATASAHTPVPGEVQLMLGAMPPVLVTAPVPP